jgi:hypothetical protein
MGQIQAPVAVLPLLAVTSRYDEAFVWTEARFQAAFGTLQLSSRRFTFDQTDYYALTMGSGLMKQFFAAGQLRDPSQLSDWKVATNAWELEYAAIHPTDEPRPLNLDPGYVTQDKLVLASTKNHAHRIYLRAGIYAEITLQYRGRHWEPCPWTYPDYRQSEYHDFLVECREYLREQLRHDPSPGVTI